MKPLLCPSMMCCNFSNLKEEMALLEEAKIDMYHCDIMDGTFVPNMALGISDIQAIRSLTNKKIDAHLMIDSPANKVDWFIDAGADIIYLHPESEMYVIKTIQHIHERKKEAGIAINPDISLVSLEELYPFCDYILVMTVNPGFAGQSFIESMDRKIERLVQLKQKYGFQIIMDGACSPEIIKAYSCCGVDGFVLGTSALFKEDKKYKERLDELRDVCGR